MPRERKTWGILKLKKMPKEKKERKYIECNETMRDEKKSCDC